MSRNVLLDNSHGLIEWVKRRMPSMIVIIVFLLLIILIYPSLLSLLYDNYPVIKECKSGIRDCLGVSLNPRPISGDINYVVGDGLDYEIILENIGITPINSTFTLRIYYPSNKTTVERVFTNIQINPKEKIYLNPEVGTGLHSVIALTDPGYYIFELIPTSEGIRFHQFRLTSILSTESKFSTSIQVITTKDKLEKEFSERSLWINLLQAIFALGLLFAAVLQVKIQKLSFEKNRQTYLIKTVITPLIQKCEANIQLFRRLDFQIPYENLNFDCIDELVIYTDYPKNGVDELYEELLYRYTDISDELKEFRKRRGELISILTSLVTIYYNTDFRRNHEINVKEFEKTRGDIGGYDYYNNFATVILQKFIMGDRFLEDGTKITPINDNYQDEFWRVYGECIYAQLEQNQNAKHIRVEIQDKSKGLIELTNKIQNNLLRVRKELGEKYFIPPLEY